MHVYKYIKYTHTSHIRITSLIRISLYAFNIYGGGALSRMALSRKDKIESINRTITLHMYLHYV